MNGGETPQNSESICWLTGRLNEKREMNDTMNGVRANNTFVEAYLAVMLARWCVGVIMIVFPFRIG